MSYTPIPIERIVIVSPRNTYLGHFGHFLPNAPPIGAGLLAARMRALGEQVFLWDLGVREVFRRNIEEIAPEGGRGTLFGISSMTPNAYAGYAFAGLVREVAPEALIVYGGIHPTALPEEALTVGLADAVVRGEGEETLPELVRRLRSGEDLAGLPGVSFRSSQGTIVHGPPASPVPNLEQYPSFPYDLLDLSKYHLGHISSSRGCPYDCIFCSQRLITGHWYRYRSTESVMNELEFLVRDCGQRTVMFIDDVFAGNPRRVKELCAEIRRRGLHQLAAFGAQVRADSLHVEMLQVMRNAGFEDLSLGVETGSEKIMKFINKKETVAKIVEGTRMARRLGFSVEGTIIFGFPAETFEDRLRGFSLAQRLGLGRVRFNNLTPYPGTRLFDMAVQEGRLSITEGWANFNSAGATASKLCSGFVLPYVPHGTTDGALQGEVLWANILSYLSIKRIFRMITPSRQPTGIGFQFTFMQFLRPARIFRLALALATVAVRAMWWFVFEKECRRFVLDSLRGRFPALDPQVEEALTTEISFDPQSPGDGRAHQSA